MAEKEIQLFDTQEELMAYVREQQQAGADKQPYFQQVREGLENYGEMVPGIKSESRAKLVRALGLLAQVAAKGLLKGLEEEPNFVINGVNHLEHPEIGPNIWLGYWLGNGMTNEKSGQALKGMLPSGIRLDTRSDRVVQQQASMLISVGNNFLEQQVVSLGMEPLEYRAHMSEALHIKIQENHPRRP